MHSKIFKRLFDMITSGIALIILSPILGIVALLVFTKLGRPVIFAQLRPGKNNEIFKMYKFRSMTNEKDAEGRLLPDAERLTKFGKLLRATSIDELPQLWNIFTGKMALIGPRPKLVKDIVFFDDNYNRRALVRPGLTGLAQVNGRNSNSWEQTIGYDLEYVEKISLLLDIKIFFKTILMVIKRDGINTEGQVTHEYYGDYLLRTGKLDEATYHYELSVADKLISMGKSKIQTRRTDRSNAVAIALIGDKKSNARRSIFQRVKNESIESSFDKAS